MIAITLEEHLDSIDGEVVVVENVEDDNDMFEVIVGDQHFQVGITEMAPPK